MSDLVRGVVVAHVDLAEAMVRAVEGISGVLGALRPVSNQGLGLEELRRVIAEVTDEGDTILFVDLGGGSCGLASLGLAKTTPRVACVTGTNLPMLLDFVFHREMRLDALVARVLEKGQGGQRAHVGAESRAT